MGTITANPSAVSAAHSGEESRWARRRVVSAAMRWACIGSAGVAVVLLVLVAGYLLALGVPGIGWELFTRDATGNPEDVGGLRHAIAGTGTLILAASVVGVPLGVLAGVYLSENSRDWLAKPTRFVCDVLAGVPSIVVGILGYELVVVPMGHFNGWAGALALAFIIVPIVARTTEEMLRLVPDSYRAGSLALGATRAQTILRVVLPSAAGSMVTGVMLAIARVAGETAPLLFTALEASRLSGDLGQPFPSLTVQIYKYVTGPYQGEKQAGWAGIVVLIGLLLGLNLVVRVVSSRVVRLGGKS